MGSPEFAVPSLEALVEARFDVRLVVTQPDSRAGRGRRLEETAVKACARRHGLDAMDWGRDDADRVYDAVRAIAPDAVVVVAFGHILRRRLLELPRFGCLNVHASLLPRWRGVSPVHYAILHGDAWTGVTLMRMDEGVDTGPILDQKAVAIDPAETAGDLLDRLAGHGADLLINSLRALEGDRLPERGQGDVGAVYAPKLNRSLSPIRWERPVTTVHNQIRGLQPWPGGTTFLNERQIKITEARPDSFATPSVTPGTVVSVDEEGICIGCGEGTIRVTGLQNPGGKPMTAAEFLRGHKVDVGTVLRS